MLWFSFVAYVLMSTLALFKTRRLGVLLDLHALALVLALPSGVLLLVLRVWTFGPVK